MKFSLKDGMPRKKGIAEVTVSKNGNMLEIGASGYGEHDALPGFGSPIVIEFYENRLRVMVFSDINHESPTHVIDLEGARESARRPEDKEKATQCVDKPLGNLRGRDLEASAETGLGLTGAAVSTNDGVLVQPPPRPQDTPEQRAYMAEWAKQAVSAKDASVVQATDDDLDHAGDFEADAA